MAYEDDDGAAPFEPRKGRKGAADSVAPNLRAAEILQEQQLVTDSTGKVWRYTGSHWVEAPEPYLAKLAWDADGSRQSSARRRGEIVSALKAMTFDPLLRWGRVAPHELAFANGVLDMRSGRMRNHEPEDYLDRVIPWDYTPGADCQTWTQSLIDWFGEGDEGGELMAALQEFFGYVLMSHARFKKCLILWGQSNCGKSQIVYAAIQMVGSEQTCQLGVEHMEDPTRRAVIVGKALNVMTELSAEALIRDGGFKTMVSTEEPLLIDEKYRPAYMYVPTAKHLIATNALPSVTDRSEGTFNRLLILPMWRVIDEDRQDRALDAKHLAEMPGVVAWAVEGAKRLFARGGEWPEPAASRKALVEYRSEQNPVVRFLEECFVRDPGAAEPLSVLVKQFNAWQGGKRTTPRALGAMLRRAEGDGAVRKVRLSVKAGGQVVRCLVGWRFEGLTRDIRFTVDPGQVASGDEELTASRIDDHGAGA